MTTIQRLYVQMYVYHINQANVHVHLAAQAKRAGDVAAERKNQRTADAFRTLANEKLARFSASREAMQ